MGSGASGQWVGIMPSQAKKYLEYAQQCVRLAEHAHSPQHRDKLLELACMWMDAALTEEKHSGPRVELTAAH